MNSCWVSGSRVPRIVRGMKGDLDVELTKLFMPLNNWVRRWVLSLPAISLLPNCLSANVGYVWKIRSLMSLYSWRDAGTFGGWGNLAGLRAVAAEGPCPAQRGWRGARPARPSEAAVTRAGPCPILISTFNSNGYRNFSDKKFWSPFSSGVEFHIF